MQDPTHSNAYDLLAQAKDTLQDADTEESLEKFQQAQLLYLKALALAATGLLQHLTSEEFYLKIPPRER